MRNPAYTLLGWIAWQVARRVARRKLAQNRAKLAVLGGVALALAAGAAAARDGGGE